MSTVAPRHLLAIVLITVIWGLNLVVSKLGVRELAALQFTTLRFVLLALLTWPFLRVVRGKMGAMFVAALLCGGLNFALLFAGLAIAKNVSSVAIASQLGVPFTTMLSVALLGETVRWRRWSGIALSFAGVLVMGFDPQVFAYWPSLVLAIASAFVGALGVISVKRLTEFKPLEMQAWFTWISLPLLAALTAVASPIGLDGLQGLSPTTWGAVAYTAIAGSLIGHTAFYYLVQRYPVTSVAPLTVLSPVFSVVFGVTLLHDVLTPRLLAGGFLTLTGVLIIQTRERRLTDTGS